MATFEDQARLRALLVRRGVLDLARGLLELVPGARALRLERPDRPRSGGAEATAISRARPSGRLRVRLALLERGHRQPLVVAAAPSRAPPAPSCPPTPSPGRCCGCGRRSRSPCRRDTPGTWRASAWATWSKVLWSSLRTMTRQCPPRAPSGPAMRGSSMVCDMAPGYRPDRGSGAGADEAGAAGRRTTAREAESRSGVQSARMSRAPALT